MNVKGRRRKERPKRGNWMRLCEFELRITGRWIDDVGDSVMRRFKIEWSTSNI